MDRRDNQTLSLVGEKESPFEQLGFIESSKRRRDAPHIEFLSSLIHFIILCRSYISVDTRPWCTHGRPWEWIIKRQGWIVLVSTIPSDSSAHLYPNKLATWRRWQKNECATGRERKHDTTQRSFIPAACTGNSEQPRGTLVFLHLCFAPYLCFPSVSHLLRFLPVSSLLRPRGPCVSELDRNEHWDIGKNTSKVDA